MVIENRPGASGTLGVDAVTKAAPDGYTILITTGDFITVPSLMPATAYDPYKDLIPVTRIATVPLLLLTHPASGIASVKDVIAKGKAEPGRLAFGSPGHGTINQLAVEWLALEAGIKLLHVPYRGGAALVNGLAAGDTALGVTTLTSVKGLVDDGKIKVVAQLNRERPAFLQQWPTMADSGTQRRCRPYARPLCPDKHAGRNRIAPRCRDAGDPEERGAAQALQRPRHGSFADQSGGTRRTHPQRSRTLQADHRAVRREAELMRRLPRVAASDRPTDPQWFVPSPWESTMVRSAFNVVTASRTKGGDRLA